MRSFGLLFRRELASTFQSLWTYSFIAIFGGILGYVYKVGLYNSGRDMLQAIFGVYGVVFWLTMLLAPLLTMRLFVDEKRTGSLELLMTAPVSDAVVTASKLLAAFVSFLVFFLPLWVVYAALAFVFKAEPDWGQLGAFTLGFGSLGLVFLSFGVLASAAAANHLSAGLLTIVGETFLIMPSMVAKVIDPESKLFSILDYLDFELHLRTFALGIVDLRYLTLDVSLAALFYFWTVRIVEARRWL